MTKTKIDVRIPEDIADGIKESGKTTTEFVIQACKEKLNEIKTKKPMPEIVVEI